MNKQSKYPTKRKIGALLIAASLRKRVRLQNISRTRPRERRLQKKLKAMNYRYTIKGMTPKVETLKKFILLYAVFYCVLKLLKVHSSELRMHKAAISN